MAKIENNKNNKNNQESIPEKIEHGVEQVKEVVTDVVTKPVETAEAFAEQAAKDVTSRKWWAKLLLVIFWVGLFLVGLFLIAVNLPATKNWAAQRVINKLNKDLKTKMSFDSVDVNYFGDITIYNVGIKDHKNYNFIKAKTLYANSDWFSIINNSRNLQFNSLSLDKMDMKVITYKGDSISNFIRFVGLFDSGKPSDPKKEPFQLKTRIIIGDSKVSIVNQNSPGQKGRWLDAEGLNLVVPELKVNGANVSAQITNFNFIAKRWGKKHLVRTFTTDFSLTKNFLSLKDLTFYTDKSLLQGNIKFNLNNGSWSDFTNKVRWDMQLNQGSYVNGYDMSYFMTNWDNRSPLNISGKMTGPLNNFYLENFALSNPDVNIRTSTMKLQNLLDGKFLIETNYVSTDFTYKDLKAALPTFIAKNLKNFADDFGRLRYNGSVRVMPEQIYVPSGNLLTGIGSAKINNFYLDDYSTDLPKYKGFADVQNLNVATITKSKQVGLVSGKFNIDGESFDVNKMRLRTKSQVASIEIMGKEINNLYLDGYLNQKVYNGIINVNDEQAKADVKGLIDFRTSRILADINANIRHLNLNYFTGGKGTQTLAGQIDGKIAMSNLNDLNLDADLKNLAFSNGVQKYLVPNAKLKAFFENGNRIVSVDAPGAVNGKISGKYNLEDLAGMIENGFNKILVGPAPRKMYRGQNFNMEFDVRQGLVSYFAPDLIIPHGANINGAYDGNSNNLVLNLDAAELKYYLTKEREITDADKALAASNPDYKLNPRDLISRDSAMVSNVVVRINTANLEEQIFAKIDRVEYNKNVFKDVILTGRNENKSTLHLAANFQHGTLEEEVEENLKSYAINLNQTTNAAGDYIVRFEPTEVKFNDVIWKIDTSAEINHSITYRKKTADFFIQNFKIYSDDSELLVKTATFKSAKDFEADAEVKNLQIGKLLAMQSGGNAMDIEGIANGTFNIKMNKSNLEPIIDLQVNNLTMNNEDMGDIVISAKNSSTPNVFDVQAKVVSAGIIGDNNLLVNGTINNNTSSPTINLKADMDDFDLKFANQFVEGVFSNMRGKANGELIINGTLKDLDYSGNIALKQFGLKLNFTGVDYSFDDNVINLSRGLAVLNNIGIKDGRSNSSGTISGAIRFETLSSMAVQLVLNANNLMVLNTTQKDYDLFWGRVYGQGDLYVSGPVSGLSIETPQANPFRALNNSTFTFNSNSTSSVEEFKMLRFLKEDKGGVISLEEKKRSGANMNLDFNLALDKGTTINVLVGDGIGDISVRGNAENLSFRMSRQGAISMNGTYLVDNGTFVSKAILNRTFQIVKGSNIRWDGDAMAPALDITANYVRTVSNAGDYLNVGYLQPVNVLLQTRITETLNKPKIELGVSAMDVSSQVKETLSAKMSQEDEKIMQFGSVLLLNKFNTSNSASFNVGAIAEDSGYSMLFKQLGSVLNTISNEFQIDLNYVKGDEASNTGDRANAGVSFSLSPRVTVKTGLGIPLSRGAEATNEKQLLSGEGTVEYDASKKNDGTLILRGYSKPMNIGMTGAGTNGSANQTYGVGVVYTKSFNTIFKRKKKDKNETSENSNSTRDSIKNDSIK